MFLICVSWLKVGVRWEVVDEWGAVGNTLPTTSLHNGDGASAAGYDMAG